MNRAKYTAGQSVGELGLELQFPVLSGNHATSKALDSFHQYFNLGESVVKSIGLAAIKSDILFIHILGMLKNLQCNFLHSCH